MLTNRIFFIGIASDLPSTFFCFCNTCLFVTFRTSFGVAGPNIILLCSEMASKSMRYNNMTLNAMCFSVLFKGKKITEDDSCKK